MRDDGGDENVLLIAYGCEPGRGSEAAIGWSHATSTARRRPTWVVTHPRGRRALDEGIAAWNADERHRPITAIYVDVPRPLRRLECFGYAGFNLYYYLWCLAAERAAVRVDEAAGVGLAQHVSLSRWWMPSPAAAVARRGAAFVWGPVGAGETMPWRFRRGIGVRGHLTELSRAAARGIFRRDPRLRRCARLATLAAAEPRETAARFASLGVAKVERLMSLPCEPAKMRDVVPAAKPPGVFRVVSGGGLVYWKRFDLSLRAFARAFADVPQAEYVHVCGGRMLRRTRRLADRLGVGERVRLTGETPHAENLRWVASADVYVLPTMRDTTGHVFEALSAGVPVVAADRLSAGAILTPRCGVAIDLKRHPTPAAFVAAMAAAMRRLYDEPATRARLSAGARGRAAELSEDRFGEALRRVQALALAKRAGRPSMVALVRPDPSHARPQTLKQAS